MDYHIFLSLKIIYNNIYESKKKYIYIHNYCLIKKKKKKVLEIKKIPFNLIIKSCKNDNNNLIIDKIQCQ